MAACRVTVDGDVVAGEVVDCAVGGISVVAVVWVVGGTVDDVPVDPRSAVVVVVARADASDGVHVAAVVVAIFDVSLQVLSSVSVSCIDFGVDEVVVAVTVVSGISVVAERVVSNDWEMVVATKYCTILPSSSVVVVEVVEAVVVLSNDCRAALISSVVAIVVSVLSAAVAPVATAKDNIISSVVVAFASLVAND